jgi:hypothetical protein
MARHWLASEIAEIERKAKAIAALAITIKCPKPDAMIEGVVESMGHDPKSEADMDEYSFLSALALKIYADLANAPLSDVAS